MACKSYAPSDEDGVGLEVALLEAYADHRSKSTDPITPRFLLKKESGSYIMRHYGDSQFMFEFSADEILDTEILSEDDLKEKLTPIQERFKDARNTAVFNTSLYLSSVGEMDAYVATSMRTPKDFHNIADICDKVFSARQLRKLYLRFFDPTMSAAMNHQDKGLIECLMVKCAKVLIYIAGERDSYGKDAEAAMALSLGKPVIFLCDSEERQRFYKDVHPLSRLVDFETGVAIGAIVTDNIPDVVELLERVFSNSMQYSLEKKSAGYLELRENITKSVVRLQTNDALLRETFWNYYQVERPNTNYVERL